MSVPFDADAIRMLAGILTETGLTEIEIGDKDFRLRVAKTPAQVVSTQFAPASAPAAAAAPTAAPPPPAVTDANHPGAVTSPMVGVVYLSAEPGTPPYVSVGQTIQAGHTLLLIEAMKTFNQIKAPRAGKVTKILVQSGVPVEFGEPLLIIE
jgi:acetyl-CoA carboxylase biotin carboxyl carrier protein